VPARQRKQQAAQRSYRVGVGIENWKQPVRGLILLCIIIIYIREAVGGVPQRIIIQTTQPCV